MDWYYAFIDLLLIAFVVVMFRHTLLRGRFFLHVFQQKGYKFNEFWHWMVDHWNRYVLTAEHFLFIVIIVGMLWLVSSSITGSAAIVILSLFGIFWFGKFNYYRGQKEKKPLVFTPRVIRLCVPFVLLCAFIPAFFTWIGFTGHVPFTDISFQFSGLVSGDIYILSFGWIVGNALIPFWIFVAGKITQPIENHIHRGFIDDAKAKLSRMPDLTVIAITGSYGKTSTKFMIRDLLKERFNVCSTPGSYNTPMGICKVINNDLEAHHQVLILEMGARYEGNIDELCDIAEPNISVVTNVGIAHLETFGSQEAIARTKSTLVKRLKPKGTAVLNGDDERVSRMATLRDDISVIKVGLENGSIIGNDISYNHEGIQFSVTANGQTEVFKTKLLGKHNVQNMLLAVGVGHHLGMRLKTMSLAAADIEPIEHRLELKKQGDLYVIDDAFNSNPVGAKNAVEILAQFNSGRRIIITPGMIELGELEAEKNIEFGEAIGRANLDLVILVGDQRTEPIQKGIAKTGFDTEKVKVVSSLFEANDIARDFAAAGDVILYENDLPDSYNE
ncbi:MAG: UDP-N-acetylmuramoyl-tripeptide--D-alanyl-D-alanine ligase [Balneolaceae bacterium]|nr:UDP-N-acetylmuramoyl-tripeptide--D-alanyl-D-alanine ligase [Balneolaceae bacterium]